MCLVVAYAHLSLCFIVTMEENLKLVSSCWCWCQIRNLENLFLGSLISLRDGSVLGTHIWISTFKWTSNKNSKFNMNCTVEQTLQHSLIPLFFGTPCIFLKRQYPIHWANISKKILGPQKLLVKKYGVSPPKKGD